MNILYFARKRKICFGEMHFNFPLFTRVKHLPAKAYGIKTGEPVVNAFRKCPSLVTQAPDHTLYEKRSGELMAYLSSVCPDIEIQSVCVIPKQSAMAFQMV